MTSKEVQAVEATATSVNIGGVDYKITRRVNVPVLKHADGEVVTFEALQPIRDEVNYVNEEVIVNGEKVKATREVIISILRVRELTSNQEMEYVCNSITSSDLKGTYPNHDYVGREFAIQKLGLVPGKNYKAVNVVEIERA